MKSSDVKAKLEGLGFKASKGDVEDLAGIPNATEIWYFSNDDNANISYSVFKQGKGDEFFLSTIENQEKESARHGVPAFTREKDKVNDRTYVLDMKMFFTVMRIKNDVFLLISIKTRKEADKIMKAIEMD